MGTTMGRTGRDGDGEGRARTAMAIRDKAWEGHGRPGVGEASGGEDRPGGRWQ